MGVKGKSNGAGFIAQQLELRAGKHGIAEWDAVDADTLIAAISAAASHGGALRFGYSRDGGAYAIGIYGDGDPYTVYVRPSEDIDAALSSIAAAYNDLAFDPPEKSKKA